MSFKASMIKMLTKNHSHIRNKVIYQTYNELFKLIVEKVEEGETVTIYGFGSFKLVLRQPRENGVEKGKPYYRIRFLASKSFKNRFN